jgi:general secretion pathway protein G
MGVRRRILGLVAVVIFAISLLAFIRIFCSRHFIPFETVQHMRVVAELQAIQTGLLLYKAENGSYPTTAQRLSALVVMQTSSPVPMHWTKRISALPQDPWEHQYVYRCAGRTHHGDFDLFSPGPDDIPDTADDDWGQ